jgi:tRNA 2-selenouridine synthase
VRDQLEQLPLQFTYQVLRGLTGSGKTHILQQLAQRGVQVLDLESLANHRGSLLGQEWEGKLSPQPSQKYFESLLLQQLQTFDDSKPVWVEAESNKIGQLYIPSSLWQKMKQASCIEIQLPQAARIEWLLQHYGHFAAHPDLLKQKLEHLKARYGWKKINEWYSLIDAGQGYTLVRDLLQNHYDPTYKQSINHSYNPTARTLQPKDLSEASVDALLDDLLSSSPD